MNWVHKSENSRDYDYLRLLWRISPQITELTVATSGETYQIRGDLACLPSSTDLLSKLTCPQIHQNPQINDRPTEFTGITKVE
jgi:hypothetical protein